MKRSRQILTLMIFLTLLFPNYWFVQAEETDTQFLEIMEKSAVKLVIEKYFDARYKAHSTLQLDAIENIFNNWTEPNNNLPEIEKLEIELYHAKLNHLRYIEYEIQLDFNDITMDKDFKTATVSVVEGHDVVFELSAPNISSMRNLQHIIFLQKENDVWKIVSDDYKDYVWNLLRATSWSKEEYLLMIDNANQRYFLPDEMVSEENCLLPSDDTSYAYNREGATIYAHNWAYNRNPNYYNFEEEGGDCTNFVSQSIHEGGNGSMEFGGDHGIGTNGWYYYSVNDRAVAWTWVDRFYSFVVDEVNIWDRGPEGCEVSSTSLSEGDIIQYEWHGDDEWDHSVIVVERVLSPYGLYYEVAGHSPDVDYYPDQFFDYFDIRYIHIERIDGAFVNLPVILRGNIQNPEGPESYPAPMDMAVGDLVIEDNTPYPVP